MRRRDLFSKLATIAAAVTLAPVAQAEAASLRALEGHLVKSPNAETMTLDIGVPVDAALFVQGTTVLNGDLIVNGCSMTDLLAEARAEGYERREYVEARRAESRSLHA